MPEDYYQLLGLSRGASDAEINKAYRKLAAKYHPDKNPDDKSAKQKFQQLQTAYDVLKDPEKRKLYDQLGPDFERYQAGGPTGGAGSYSGRSYSGGAGPQYGQYDFNFEDLFGGGGGGGGGSPFGDIFEQMRGGGGGRSGGAGRGSSTWAGTTSRRGSDLRTEATIDFATSIVGGQVQFSLQRPDGTSETLTVKIPAGIKNGEKIRLRGQGNPGTGNGSPGDIFLTVQVRPHTHFTRKGNDLYVKVPVTLAEAALGSRIDVPTPEGTVTLRIPKGSSGGTKLRIRSQGAPDSKTKSKGDLYAELVIKLPDELTAEDRRFLEDWDAKYPLQPRKDLFW
ncbi:DnaJ-class molecular chaperone with C-terminal Zn finger domain [Planctomycetales bacterium 10988]|nr:DnaJ-class molecular chaperone with C-terminal Zn finger domain [Planctomycetales bacterium 10988]